jgi:chromosome segregation ATPase
VNDPKPLRDALRDSIEARKELHPMEFRVCNLEKKLPEIERGLKGNNWQANLCVAECREATADVKAMGDTITAQNETIAELKAAVGSLQADLAAACERIENMAQWAKTKGKT